jgi:hypothetical protein
LKTGFLILTVEEKKINIKLILRMQQWIWALPALPATLRTLPEEAEISIGAKIEKQDNLSSEKPIKLKLKQAREEKNQQFKDGDSVFYMKFLQLLGFYLHFFYKSLKTTNS